MLCFSNLSGSPTFFFKVSPLVFPLPSAYPYKYSEVIYEEVAFLYRCAAWFAGWVRFSFISDRGFITALTQARFTWFASLRCVVGSKGDFAARIHASMPKIYGALPDVHFIPWMCACMYVYVCVCGCVWIFFQIEKNVQLDCPPEMLFWKFWEDIPENYKWPGVYWFFLNLNYRATNFFQPPVYGWFFSRAVSSIFEYFKWYLWKWCFLHYCCLSSTFPPPQFT